MASIVLVCGLFIAINNLDPNSALAINLQNLTRDEQSSSASSSQNIPIISSTTPSIADDAEDEDDSTTTKTRTCRKNQVLKNGKCVLSSTTETTVTEVETTDETTVTETITKSETSPGASSPTELLCKDRAGPQFIKQVHWYTAAEQQANPDLAGTVGLAVWYFTTTVRMHFVDDTCRPHLQPIGDDDLMGSDLTATPLSALQYSTDPADQAIIASPGQDLVIWYWSDGTYTIERTDDIYQIWNY